MFATPPRPKRRAVAALLASGLAFSGSAALLAPGTGAASSHREAPLILDDPLLDNTDVYAFRSTDKPDTTTLIANWIPFEDPAGAPNFYAFGADGYSYNIKIDNDGDARPDIVYSWLFRNAH